MTLVYAHRGASGDFPENTLLAFSRAIATGVDGIELDVHATSDGVPVVIHDRGVERTTNGLGFVDQMPLARLRSFAAGDGQLVPTLAEVLDLVAGSAHLDIEIKGTGIEAGVLGVLRDFPAARWAVSSFDWDTLRRLRAHDAMAEIWPLAECWSDEVHAVAIELCSPAVSLYAGAYDVANAAKMREAGLRAVIWTVNEPDEARRVRDLGAHAICTDFPAAIAAALSGV